MANPNIVNVSEIYGKTAVQSVTTTATAIVTNAANSNKVIKVNALYISNIDATSNEEITVDIFRAGTAYHITKTVVVPTGATLDVISKAIYLQEDDALRLTAGSDSKLQAVCSYEEIS
jgi:hypothetical protein